MDDRSSVIILPDSRLSKVETAKNVVFRAGAYWVPIFCINCGKDGGLVPEENITSCSYLCDPCAEKYGAIEGTVMIPDEVFWETVKQAQIEKYGRPLTAVETEVNLADTGSLESLLARDRANLTPHSGS